MSINIKERCLYPETEKMPREQLKALQLKKLKYQAEYVYNRSSFYRDLFQKASLRPEDIQKLDDIKRLPMIDKSDLLRDQAEGSPYGKRLCVEPDEIAMTILTSGTSGVGQEVYAMTRNDLEFSGSAWAIWFYRAGIVKGDVIMLTWPLGTNSGPQAAFLGAYKIGANTFPIGMYDSKIKINSYLTRFNPAGILATPSYLTQLSILCKEMGVDPKKVMPGLKSIFVGTEAYPISWAEEMEDFWDAKLHDLYGCTQQGAMAACTCERGAIINGERGLMHLDESSTLYEIIDRETGVPVKPGEEGELVLTNLNRQGTPLFRFRTNDRVRYVSYTECLCGRTSDCLVPSSVARYDDMIKIKSQNVWPEAIDEVVFSYHQVEEYNGIVSVSDQGKESVNIKLEFKKSCSLSGQEKTNLILRLEKEINSKTGISMKITEVSNGTLDRFLFKTRRWTDERNKGLERVKHVLGGSKSESN